MKPTIGLSLVIDPSVEPVSTREFEGILDVAQFGNIIGVEILSPAHHWGSHALANIAGVNPQEPVLSVSWDRDVDAMYVRLLPKETRSVRQQYAKGIAWFGHDGRMCKLDIAVEATTT